MMKSAFRAFSRESNLQALAAGFPDAHLHVMDLPYRLSSWALDEPGNGALWVDAAGELRAWAVLQTPFWTLDWACAPDHAAALFPQVLQWGEARIRAVVGTVYERPCWFVNVFAEQIGLIGVLEQAGFACQSGVGEDAWEKVWLRRPAQLGLPAQPLPPGFTIRPLAGEAEVAAYVNLHRAVFESKSMTVEWRTRVLRHPQYLPALDWVVEASDGRLAGFCIGWLAACAGDVRGQIEPLGVHADFRGLGLGRALLAAVLSCLGQLGAVDVYVETDRYRDAALTLYETIGFRIIQDLLVYSKAYGGE